MRPELDVYKRQALDAVNLMFAGINAMRQQTRNDARVAGIITSGGAACNIIPDYAACQFYIRAKDRAYLEELTQKVINCAKGAELMTGAKLEYFNFENSYDDLVYHDGLRALMRKNLNDLGVTDFVDRDEEASGSSDIGNVSHVCPTVYCELDTGARPKVFAPVSYTHLVCILSLSDSARALSEDRFPMIL